MIEPVRVIDHDRIRRAAAEGEKFLEHRLDAVHVGLDGFVGDQRAALVAPRRIADLGRPAAHQHDRLVPRLLQPAQDHDLHQAARMQAFRGAVEADIGGDDFLSKGFIQRV